jgi:hypothetical protein
MMQGCSSNLERAAEPASAVNRVVVGRNFASRMQPAEQLDVCSRPAASCHFLQLCSVGRCSSVIAALSCGVPKFCDSTFGYRTANRARTLLTERAFCTAVIVIRLDAQLLPRRAAQLAALLFLTFFSSSY